MPSISEVKSENLKTFLKTYRHFTSLKEGEQQEYLEKIIRMDINEQEKVYKFLFEENEKEKVRMLKALNEKLAELSKVLKKIKTREEENIIKADDDSKLDELEKQIENS